MSWIIFIVCLAFFTWRGYKQGVIGAIGKIVSFVAAYAAAFFLSQPVASIIENNTTVQGMFAYLLAGIGVFFFTSFVVDAIFNAIAKAVQGDEPQSALSSGLGAGTGFVVGGVVGLVLVFFVSYLQEVQNSSDEVTSVAAGELPKANAIESVAKTMAGKTIEAVSAASDMDDATAKLTAALATDPAAVMNSFKSIMNSESAQVLFNDPHHAHVLASGDVEAIKQLPAFQKLASSDDMKKMAEVSGMTGENYEAELADKISSVWSRANTMQNDPELQALMNDPQIQAQLKNKNPMALLSDKRFMSIASKLLNSNPQEMSQVMRDSNFPASEMGQPVTESTLPPTQLQSEHENTNATDAPKDPPKIYQWRDEEGRLHFSDEPVNGQ